MQTIWSEYLERLENIGFSDIRNFPTVALIDKNFLLRRNLEKSSGMTKRLRYLR